MSGMNKINSIRSIQQLKLNTHNTVITKSLAEALNTIKEFSQFTVRTDADRYEGLTWGNGSDLPFYMQPEPLDDVRYLWFKNEFTKLLDAGFYLIIANGIKYDNIQCYNAVVRLQSNGDFKADMSVRKVPLRKMYQYGDMFGAIGNIADELSEVFWMKQTPYDRHDIVRDMGLLYTYEIYNKDIELTRYPMKVGTLNDYFVFWQIR